jgi:hypothetical protein
VLQPIDCHWSATKRPIGNCKSSRIGRLWVIALAEGHASLVELLIDEHRDSMYVLPRQEASE